MSNKKDFSEETKLQLMKDLQETKAIPDALAFLYQDPEMSEVLELCEPYIPEINRSMTKISDRANASLSALGEIWTKVSEVDDRYAQQINTKRDELTALKSEFEKLVPLLQNGGDPLQCPLLTLSATDLQTQISGFGGTFTDINLEETYDLKLQQECFELMEREPYNITEEEWQAMSNAEKEAFLQPFFTDVQKIMGTDIDISYLCFTGAVSWNGMFDTDRNGNTRVQIQLGDRDLQGLFQTIIHETRHAYQQEVMTDYDDRTYLENLFAANPDIPNLIFTYKDVEYSRDTSGPNRHPFTSDATADVWSDTSKNPGSPTAAPGTPLYETQYVNYISGAREYDTRCLAGQNELPPEQRNPPAAAWAVPAPVQPSHWGVKPWM